MSWEPKELFQLAGNGMAVRCVMVAIAVALRALNPKLAQIYMKNWYQCGIKLDLDDVAAKSYVAN